MTGRALGRGKTVADDVKCLEWTEPDCGVLGCIIPEFNIVKIVEPTPWLLTNKTTKISSKTPI
ncbi:hypothetical protein Scep_014583 [Stephania cephalantha]|uniref:Uncharacterized protein n=1 Tax=Stephania cephalantha TaxID=152367 RepID=A0AAP0NZI9_9MAGN